MINRTRFVLSFEVIGEELEGVAVAGKAFASYAGKAGHASIRDLPEVLALIHGRDVDLDSGDAHGFECIENADARMRKRSRIDDDAVHRAVRILNSADD